MMTLLSTHGRHIALGLNNPGVGFCIKSNTQELAMPTITSYPLLEWTVSSLIIIYGVGIIFLRGHQQQICGLKWSPSRPQLASGGNDNLIHIWDPSMAASNSPARWLHRYQDHTAAVKALAWCPFQTNLLASGGVAGDRSIKFWNTHTSACFNSVDTGSQVCALLWNKNERQLFSSHGFSNNQLTLWKYPSMGKIADLTSVHDSVSVLD